MGFACWVEGLLEARRIWRLRRGEGSFKRWDARRRNLVSIFDRDMISILTMRKSRYREIIEQLWKGDTVVSVAYLSDRKKMKPELPPPERHRACLSAVGKSRD
jgi:hypothetical protein